MRRLAATPALLLASLSILLCAACNRGSGPPADPAPRRREPPVLAATTIDGTELMASRCVICHSLDYLSQQRLSAPQWRKTVDKMRLFGAPLSDDEAGLLATLLARSYPPELPPPIFLRVEPPPGALPSE